MTASPTPEDYHHNEKLQPMVAEISWTHNILILEKCKDDLEWEFYLRMTRRCGWTKNVLIHPIENQTYVKPNIIHGIAIVKSIAHRIINIGFHCVAPKLRNRQCNHLILHQRFPKSAAIRQHNRHLQRRIRLHLQISPGNAEF
jgi:predicted nuclease of restriction endonuclease-like (RecB) superfamily